MIQNNNFDDSFRKSKKKSRDILPKVFSVFAAVILWFYVVDIKTTVDEKVVSGVPVVLENFDNSSNNLDIVSGREHSIEVTISGIKNELADISRDDIIVSADMNGINSAGTYKLDLNITTPAGITVIKKSTSEITVFVDKTTSKHIPVEVDLRSNDVEANISEVGDPILSVASIQVSGPQKIIDSIDKMRLSLNVDVIKDTIDSKGCTVVPVDKNGNVVSSPYIKLNQSTVDVLIPVYKSADVEVVPIFSDDLNYTISYSDFSPKIITINGKVETINSIDCIFTETIDVSQRSGNFNVNLDLPDGVSAVDKSGNPIHFVKISGFVSEPVVIVPEEEISEYE